MLPRSKDIPQPYAYISEPLTGRGDLEDIKAFCLRIAKTCEEAGLYAYLPFQHSDPVLNANVTAQEVFAADKNLTQGARAVVFYLPGDPAGSFGVGGEMAIAASAKLPMAMMIRRGTTLSPFEQGFIDVEVRGKQRGPVIEFSQPEEEIALSSLAQFLVGLQA
jgi:hypothetical protein